MLFCDLTVLYLIASLTTTISVFSEANGDSTTMGFDWLAIIPLEVRVLVYNEFFAVTPFIKHAKIRATLQDVSQPINHQVCDRSERNEDPGYVSLMLTSKVVYAEAYSQFLKHGSVKFRRCHQLTTYEPRRVRIPANIYLFSGLSKLDSILTRKVGRTAIAFSNELREHDQMKVNILLHL